jgi:Spy/CpxP family protein refolding chaperone
MSFREILPATIGLSLALAAAVAAQEPPTTPVQNPQGAINTDRLRPERLRRQRMRSRKGLHGPGKRQVLRQLNLTDEQRGQRQEILQRHLEALKPQREELWQLRQKRIEGSFTAEDQARVKDIRQELRAAMQNMRGEMRNRLTDDQRLRIDTLREERKLRREELRRRREEFRRNKPQG